jgi:hypothetical protein
MTTHSKRARDLIRVGWREWVALPELGIAHVKAKVDTGARTSALHAFRVEPFEARGRRMIRFWVHPLQRRRDLEVSCVAEVKDRRMVSDSGGHRERRWVIETRLVLAGHAWPVEVTLTDRDSMNFRMLLGRTALSGRLAVDAGASFLTGRPPRTARRPTPPEVKR